MTTATVTSKDGTTITYDVVGHGPAVLLVDGALANRGMGPSKSLAEELSSDYTVYRYDRRGRGDSGDTPPYDMRREIEDLQAVAAEAGEPVSVWAISSGVPLALAAARQGSAITRLALYEFPLIVDNSREPVPTDYQDNIRAMIAAGNPGGAVKYFLRTGIGLPAALVALFPIFPGWSKNKKAGHTLAYDLDFMDDALDGTPIPAGRYDWVTLPTMVYAGGKSPEWLRNGNIALAKAIPGAEFEMLPGQTHMVKAKLFAPRLKEFLAQ